MDDEIWGWKANISEKERALSARDRKIGEWRPK
jgi:hypothetical protein